MDTFWSTANKSFSIKERNDFNKWRLGLYLAADAIRDGVSLSMPSRTGTNVKELMDIVSKIPSLLGK